MSIEDLIQNVMDNNLTGANDVFSDLMNDKIADSLQQQKIAVAGQMFGDNSEEDEIPDDEDFDISDEDLDAIIDDLDLEELE